MNTSNKTRFIHFRNTRQVPEGCDPLVGKGGATIAWKFDDSGDIVVGAPAICSVNDLYNKAEGRKIAEANLSNPTDKKPLAFVIPKAQYIEVLKAEAQSFQSMKFLSKSFRDDVTNHAAGLIADDLFNFVNIGWFEQKLRQSIIFHENQIYTANGKVYGKRLVVEAA